MQMFKEFTSALMEERTENFSLLRKDLEMVQNLIEQVLSDSLESNSLIESRDYNLQML